MKFGRWSLRQLCSTLKEESGRYRHQFVSLMGSDAWHELLRAIFRAREVKSLMGLTGRVSMVLSAVSVVTIAGAGSGSFSQERQIILEYCGGTWIFFHFLTYLLGMIWPARFHYGAAELLESERMKMGDSLSGEVPKKSEQGKK